MEMRSVLFLINFYFFITGGLSKKMVCYYRSHGKDIKWQLIPGDIDPRFCTHLIVSSSISYLDQFKDEAKEYIKLRQRSGNLSLLLSISEDALEPSWLSQALASSYKRTWIVGYICGFTRDIGFDGLDIDYRWPGHWSRGHAADKSYFASFIQELRDYVNKEAKESNGTALTLSVVIPPWMTLISNGFLMDQIARDVDMLQLMSMDYSWPTDAFVYHHAPLFSFAETFHSSIASTVDYILKLDVDPEKLILGIPLYGRSFTLRDVDRHTLGSPTKTEGKLGFGTPTPGTLAYFEICQYIQYCDMKVERPNSTAMGPYAYLDDEWVAYDDQIIIKRKVQFAFDMDLGGVMLWSLDLDDFDGRCSQRFPLTKAVHDSLNTLNKTSVQGRIKVSWDDVDPSYCDRMQNILHGLNIDGKDAQGRTRTFLAAEKGQTSNLRCLYKLGADYNITDNDGQTPLQAASAANRIETVVLLLSFGIDVNTVDFDGRSALYVAVENSGQDVIDLLLESGADPYLGPRGRTCLHAASASGRTSIVRALYRNHKGVFEKVIKYDKPEYGGTNLTPLDLAVRGCHYNTVKELVNMGSKIFHDTLTYAVTTNCTKDCLDVLKHLISSDADKKSKEDLIDGDLIFRGLGAKCQDKVLYLMNRGVDFSKRFQGETILTYALQFNEINIIKELLDKGARVNLKNSDGLTPLHLAVNRVKIEIRSRARANFLHNISATDENVESVLVGTYNHSAPVVKLLLDNGADVNLINAGGSAALHLSAEAMSVPMMRLLLDGGADLTAKTSDGYTALHVVLRSELDTSLIKWLKLADSREEMAIRRVVEPAVQFLLSKGIGIEDKTSVGLTPLHMAILRGRTFAAHLLLKQDVNVDSKDNEGMRPLHYAVVDGVVSLIEPLVDKGANVNAQDNSGYTPLLRAMQQRKDDVTALEICRILLSRGADVNMKENYGFTALAHAVNTKKDPFVVQMLIDRGAKVDERIMLGRTLLHVAVEKEFDPVVKILLDHGAKIEAKDLFGQTPLTTAVRFGQVSSAKLLLDRGANIDARDKRGLTPLDYAYVTRRKDMQRLIINRGGKESLDLIS